LLEALGAERLQQVVQRLDLERRDGVLVERRGEDHLRTVDELLQHLEPVARRHLDVQEQQIRADGVHGSDRRRAVTGFARHGDPRHIRQQVPQLLSRERLVVRDHGADSADGPTAVHSCLAGRVTVAVKP